MLDTFKSSKQTDFINKRKIKWCIFLNCPSQKTSFILWMYVGSNNMPRFKRFKEKKHFPFLLFNHKWNNETIYMFCMSWCDILWNKNLCHKNCIYYTFKYWFELNDNKAFTLRRTKQPLLICYYRKTLWILNELFVYQVFQRY